MDVDDEKPSRLRPDMKVSCVHVRAERCSTATNFPATNACLRSRMDNFLGREAWKSASGSSRY